MEKITDQLANKTILKIKFTSEEDSVEIANIENISLPQQNYNTIEVGILNAKNGIKPRLLGSTNGGDLSFKMNILDANDEGVLKVLSAYQGKIEVDFTVVYPSGAERSIPSCFISQCNPAEHSTDTLMAYDVSAVVNGLMTVTKGSVTE